MSQISFNDNALARSLGTKDPTEISALKSQLNDPDSVVTLTPVEVRSDDPVYVISTPDEEIHRIAQKYGLT